MMTHIPPEARIAIIVDTPGWFDPFAAQLRDALCEDGFRASLVRDQKETPQGDLAFYLSCTRITPAEVLARNALNLVVHASDLPRGKGFSPLVWQILEGRSEITLTMFEMAGQVDAGDIVMQRAIRFEGHELNDQLRMVMGRAIVAMCLDLARSAEPISRRAQTGEESWYRRRRPADSRLDVEQSLAAQFDLLRVVDNDRYPAWFEHRGHRYRLRIEDLGPVDAPHDPD